jgi:hypothetical protein
MQANDIFLPQSLSKPTNPATRSNLNPLIGGMINGFFPLLAKSPMDRARERIAEVTAESNARIEKNKELLK